MVSLRPMSASKTNLYYSNGTGRDSYIGINNGGFTVTNDAKTNYDRGSFPKLNIIHGRGLGGGPKSLNYHSNGSGRDSYISFGSGGLHRPETAGEYKENFIDTLRSYKGFQISSINYKPRMSNRKLLGGTMGSLKSHPELRMTTSNYDEKHRAMMNNYKKYQREIDRRLARPKYRIIRQKLHV